MAFLSPSICPFILKYIAMGTVRLFKDGGRNGDDQSKKPEYMNFDNVDYDPEMFKSQLSDINGFSSWADNIDGMAGSKIRNAVMQRAAEMGRALMDGSMSYDGIMKFTSGNSRFSSDGKTKKKWFSGNYNSKDENTVNAIAANYVLNLLRSSRVDNTSRSTQQSDDANQNELEEYNIENEYANRFSPAMLKSLGSGANDYIMKELKEMSDTISSDEYKKKYTSSSLQNAANELNSINQFYTTYNGTNWMEDDKARANMASISSPLYKLLYTAAYGDGTQQQEEKEKTDTEKIEEETDKINKQIQDEQKYRDAVKAKEEAERNLAISNFRNEYERQNAASTYRPGVLRYDIIPENTDKNWLNFTNLAFKDGYGDFLSQLSDAYVKTTHGYSSPVDRQRKWLEYLRSPYNNGIMAKYVSESGYKPKTNEELYSNILSLMSRDSNYSGQKYVLDRTIMNNGGYGLTLSFDNDGVRMSEMNPYYMAKNKYIDDAKYNQILGGLYDYSNSTQKKKNGGVMFFQSGGLMFGNYQYANPVKQNQIQYTDNELNIVNNIEKERKKIDELNKHTEKRIEKANVENDENLRDGWDKWDTARTLAAVADVGSMAMSFIPGASMAGGVVGLGGSLANFAADWGQDGLQMSDLKNLSLNIGMDLLGAIPIVGAGAKSAKVIKSARLIIPAMQIASEMTGDGALTNGYKAINKLVTPNAKMTSQDWKDLLNGVTQLAGLIKSGRGLLKGHSIKKNAKSGKALELEMTKDNRTSKEFANINDSQLRELNKKRFGNDGKLLPYRQQIEAQDAFIKEMYGNEFSLNTPVKFREGRFSGIKNMFDPQYKNVYDLSNPVDGTWQWSWGRRLVPNRMLSDSEKVFVIGKKSGYSKNRFDPKDKTVQDKPQRKTNRKKKNKKEAPKKPETEKKAGGGTGMKGSGSVYEKRGGVLNRFQSGGTVRNMGFGTDSNSSYESYNASWGDSTGRFIRNELKKLIELKNNAKTPEQIAAFESERNKFAQKMYDINKSYKSMNDKTGFGWGKEMLSPDAITESHQKLFNTLDGANAMIDQYGNLIGRGGTNDKADKWVDSLNGSKTSLRNIGYSFDGNDRTFQSSEPYKEISDMAKQVGLEYSARNDLSGNGKNYYTFNPYVGERKESLASLAKTPEPAKISVDNNGRITTGSGIYETKPTSLQDDNNGKGIVDIIGGTIGNISDIWRPILIQKTNNEVLNDRLRNMKPTLVSAPRLNAKVYNDYYALKAGENTAARYGMLADRIANNTSDFYTGLAARLSGASQGEQAMEEARRQSDAMYKSTSQNAMDVFNRNHIAGVQASNQNMAEQNRIADLKSQLRGTVKVNNLMQNWFPYLDDKKRIKYINDGILYNKEYSDYLAGRNQYIAKKLGENWQSNPDAINKARELSIEYMKNAPTPPLLAKRGGTITRRSTASINYGIGNDSYSRYFFRDINQARRDWFNHIRDVASENHKERSHAGKMISDFNKLIGYDKKK